MAGKKQGNDSEMQDFSSRYPGGKQVDVQRGGWHQFEKVGDDLVGIYMGMEPYKNGYKGTMKKTNGEVVVFSCATLLRDTLREIKVGERIAIVLTGFLPSSQESPQKVYQVFRV